MTVAPPDGSRDRRIEDPSNLHLVHPAGRALLRPAIARGVAANAVSVMGLLLGAGAALCFARFDAWPFAFGGLLLAFAWLVADGLDGMIARATGTAGPLGRVLDGLCDHGVFALIYLALAISIDTTHAWTLACIAGGAHAIQSSLYEGERARFHRRIRGEALLSTGSVHHSPIIRAYDRLAGAPDRLALPFERELAASSDPAALGRRYGEAAVAPMRLLSLLTANVRVLALFIACLAGAPAAFWWFEVIPLSLVTVAGLVWHRRVERSFTPSAPAARQLVKEQGS